MCTNINFHIYIHHLFISYPVTIFWLTLPTILFALATAPGSSWVRSVRSCETAMGNCAYYDLFLYKYKFRSSKNLSFPRQKLLEHPQIFFPPLLHTGTCSCTQGHQLWSNLQMRVQLHNQSVAHHEYQHQFCIFCKIRFDGRNPAPVARQVIPLFTGFSTSQVQGAGFLPSTVSCLTQSSSAPDRC